jgi:hypothetical protein
MMERQNSGIVQSSNLIPMSIPVFQQSGSVLGGNLSTINTAATMIPSVTSFPSPDSKSIMTADVNSGFAGKGTSSLSGDIPAVHATMVSGMSPVAYAYSIPSTTSSNDNFNNVNTFPATAQTTIPAAFSSFSAFYPSETVSGRDMTNLPPPPPYEPRASRNNGF